MKLKPKQKKKVSQAVVSEQGSEFGGIDLACSCKTFPGLQSQFSRRNTEDKLASELFTQLKS
jgi:hypothetical protein